MSTGKSVTPILISYMAGAGATALPAPVLQKTKHHILDTIAAMVSGTTLKPGRLALQYAEEQGGKPEAQVIGSSLITSAVTASLANGMLARSDETDDSNGSAGIHPGCAVIPAALAMAERENASGADLIRAVALGCDIGSRTTKAQGRDAMRARNHLPFSIGGTMGATAAAGSLAGLKEEQYRDLPSYGTQQASGVMTYPRDTEHIEKAFIFGGMTARNGVTSANMVQRGFTGVHDVFDGDGNFLAAYADDPNPQELIAELGQRYEVMLTNIKKYCVGFPIQSALEGLLLLMAEHHLTAIDVAKVEARLPEAGAHTVNDREMPDINLQYIFAVSLLDGGLSFEAAHSFERTVAADVLDLKSRITLVGDADLTLARPEGQSHVSVTTKDGTRLEQRVTTFKGKADNPLTSVEISEKARELMNPVLGGQRAVELIDTLSRLEELDRVRDLRPLLSA